MTWEIAVGMFAVFSAFVAVMNIVVRVNSTLTKLESTVKQLGECIDRQSGKNAHFYDKLSDHEGRILCLERSRIVKNKNSDEKTASGESKNTF